jgi:hypothetical protein
LEIGRIRPRDCSKVKNQTARPGSESVNLDPSQRALQKEEEALSQLGQTLFKILILVR